MNINIGVSLAANEMADGNGEANGVPWHTIVADNATCDVNLSSCSMAMDPSEVQKRDAIAAIRLIISLFGIIGALSIIGSVIIKKQVTSPKIHPIFVLSVANCLLGFSWVVGGILWFERTSIMSLCLSFSLLTVILECVSVNLTLVYALVADANIKKTDLNSMLSITNSFGPSSQWAWPPYKTFLTYLIAWTLPIALVMTSFTVNAMMAPFLGNIESCSCWCLPYFGNVVPLSSKADWPSAVYYHNVSRLVATYGVILGTNYLVVFILLLAIYRRILKRIRKMKRQEEWKRTYRTHYGAADLKLLADGESKARKRAVYFMTVFIVHGFINVLFAVFFTLYKSRQLHGGVIVPQKPHHLPPFALTLYILESVTAPLQGLLNAIVYGWTRDDFLEVIGRRRALSNVAPQEQRRDIDESIDGGHCATARNRS